MTITNYPLEVEWNRRILEDYAGKAYDPRHLVARLNNEYLLDGLAHHSDICDLIRNPEAAKRDLIERLNGMQHTYRVHIRGSKLQYDEVPEGIMDLTPRQFLRLLLLEKSLRDAEFIQELGDIVERDHIDKTTEMGGFKQFDSLWILSLSLVRSVYASQELEANDERYGVATDVYDTTRHAFLSHFHAKYRDSSKFAGPSVGIFAGDINLCLRQMKLKGESHNTVVTKLRAANGIGAFNIDYYGGEGNGFVEVIDFGVFNYMLRQPA